MADIPYTTIVTRAMRQPAFRQKVIQDPKGTVAQLGVKLGPGVDVRTVVDTVERVHVVLPREPGMRGEEAGLVKRVLDRFRADPAFHDLALKDPKAAFRQLTGTTIPKYPEVVAVEETRKVRIIHLPPLAVRDLQTFADAQALWGGGGGGWTGGDDWTIEGTYETAQACNCFSEDYGLETAITHCCPDDEEPVDPTGGGGGGPRV